MSDPGDPTIEGVDAAALTSVLRRHPLDLGLAFGSRVTGETRSDSDLDVAVRFEDDIGDEERFAALDRLTIQLEDASGIDEVDVVDLDRVGPHRAYEALRTGALLVGSPEDRIEAQARALLRKLDFDRVKETWRRGLSERIEGGDFGRA